MPETTDDTSPSATVAAPPVAPVASPYAQSVRAILGCLRLEMRAEQLTIFSDNPARALHGTLHRAIERLDAALSATIHEAAETPLVCSPLGQFRHAATAFAERLGRRIEANETV